MFREIDLSPPDYHEWLEIIMSHSWSSDEEANPGANTWYIYDEEIEASVSDRVRLVEHVTRLCRDFKSIADTYTQRQIDTAIWLLFSADMMFGGYLASTNIPLDLREQCVRSMFHPFADYVMTSDPEVPLENCYYMWWDLICDNFWDGELYSLKGEEVHTIMMEELNTSTSEEDAWWERYNEITAGVAPEEVDDVLHAHGIHPEDRPQFLSRTLEITISYDELEPSEQHLMDTMLETLVRILELDEVACVNCALHGLGHLPHPRKPAIVQEFIDKNAEDFDEDAHKWLEQCRDGTLM